MTEKLEILYPRGKANIRCRDFSKEEVKIKQEIKVLEETEALKTYKRLHIMLKMLDSEKDYFCCYNCGLEQQVKNLTLYRFISFSDGPDEDRYEDNNIICPSCGKFNYVDRKDDINARYKDIQEIYK